MITFLDLVFIGASGLVLIHGLNNRMNAGVATYLSSYLLFVLVFHTLWRLGANASYDFETYLMTHLASLVFISLSVWLSKRDIKQNELMLRAARMIKSSALLTVLVSWIAFQLYLLVKYGSSGALDLSVDGSGKTQLPYFESSSLMLVNTLASGAALMVVTRLGIDASLGRNPWMMGAFAVFVLYSLALGAALAGGRRTILILAIAFLIAKITASRDKVGAFLRRNLVPMFLTATVCLGLAWYYQQIRNNVYAPAVISNLAHPDVSTKLDGLAMLLTPGFSDQFSSRGSDASTVNRSGPFDLLFAIVEARTQFDRSSDGDLTIFSIGKVIPKMFYPDKPDYDVDHLIGMRFGVVAGRNFATSAEFFRAPDYSTTVLAMLVADFGWLAVPIAAILAVLALRSANAVIALAPNSGLVVLGAFGVVFELVSTIEGSLATMLGAMRTLLIVAAVGFALRFVGLARGRSFRRPSRA